MSLNAWDYLDGAVGYLTFNGGIRIGIRGKYLGASRNPVLFIIKFTNATEFNIFTSNMQPIHMDKPDSEVLVSDGGTGNSNENVFFFSYDRTESWNRIDMTKVSPSIFTDRNVYIKSPLTSRSFGLRFYPPPANRYDYDNVVRSWDIYENQGNFRFDIVNKSPVHAKYNAISGDNNAKVKCCTNQYGGTPDEQLSQYVCNILNYTPNSNTCDIFMDSYCPADMGNPVCSCYLNRASILDSPLLMEQYPLAKYATQPQCWNGDCLVKGYKNNGIRTSAACPSITVCTQDINKIGGSNNILKNIIVTQNCGEQATTPTTLPTSNSNNNDSTIMGLSSIQLLIFIIVICFAIMYISDDDEPPYVMYSRPSYL